jgi:peptidoglycan/xylan/chitin deacetylase (PgdA/CDA1 family)
MTRKRLYGGNHLLILGTALILLISASATAAAVAMSGGPIHVVVNGRPILLRHDHTVGDALAAAGLSVHDGRLLAVQTHRVLNEHAAPAHLLVNGHPARRTSSVRDGDRIDGEPGSDVVETLVHRVVGAGGPGPGLPDVERTVWHSGVPAGAGDVVLGERSHEVVSQSAGIISATEDLSKVVELTFDDGPDPRWTPQVLAILASEDVHATFSDVGLWVDRHPELVRQELAMGETICNHTLRHNEHLDTAPLPLVEAEMNGGADAIRAATGKDPICYRPPAGRWSPQVVASAHALGERVLDYSVDPSDYLKPPPQAIVARVLAKVQPGAVIILHDGGGDRSRTVASLRGLIDALKDGGYRFTTMGEESPGGADGNGLVGPLVSPLMLMPLI